MTSTILASSEEWELRVQLAAAYRIIEHLGWSELIWTHTTVRVPGPEHHFLINPYGLRFDEIRASNLLKIDLNGNLVAGQPQQAFNPAGFVIHSAIHMARQNARCVMHTHTTAGMAVAALQCGLLPISMYSLGFFEQVAYHDFEGPSTEIDERQRIAENLGSLDVMVMRNHGLLVCGESIGQAFVRMYRVERACQIQLAAQATGADLIVPPRSVCELSREKSDSFLSIKENEGWYSAIPNPEFEAMVRLMDSKDPSYKT